MIIVEVYGENQMQAGNPVATLSFSGRGKKVVVATKNSNVETDLAGFLNEVLALPQHSQVSPEPRQAWMEALPNAHPSIPYWFKITDAKDKITEEVEDDNESEEDTSDEEAPDEGEVAGDDSGDSDDGGADPDDGGNGESPADEYGGSPYGGTLNHNG